MVEQIAKQQEEIAEITGLLNRVKGINAPSEYYTDDELCALSEIEEYLAKHNKGE